MYRMTPWDLTARLRYKDAANPTPKEVAIRKRFLVRYPDQEENVISFQENQQCDCNAKIQKRVIDDAAALNPLLREMFEFTEDSELIIPRHLAGEIMVIPDNEKEFKELLTTCAKERWTYKGIGIFREDGNLKLYFY